MRLARVACVVIGLLVVAASSQAQTAAATDDSRFYAGVTFGATFGHQSSGSVGVEAGGQISGPVAVFLEGGHMSNVGTEALDARAQTIANHVGATSSTAYKVNYFAVGVRYSPDLAMRFRPYGALGFGLAQVKAETAFAVNGTTVPPESIGIQTGSDLNGSEKKAYFTLGGGIVYPFAKRFFVDGSYRYGRVGTSSAIENDKGINTNRVQVGLGVRF